MKKNERLLHILQQKQLYIAIVLLILSMLVYAVFMSYQSILRYETFQATAFDLGNMDQVLWNTIHGHLFQLTNQGQDWYGPPIRLAIHFEPILLLLSLLYVFHADPRILLIFQSLALAVGALPVFLLTRKFLPKWPMLALLMVLAYLLLPALIGLNIFDFHPLSLATPLLLYAALALEYKRYGWFLLACVLAASCKEDVPLAIALFGLLVIWKYKLPRLGILLFVGGIVWSVIAFATIKHFFPGAQSNNFWYRYDVLGSTPGAAIINILLHPWILLVTFVTVDRIYYLANLLRNVGFLSLLAPEWLLPTAFSLAENLLTTTPNSPTYSGVYHYNAVIIPFIMLSAIHGLRRALVLWGGWSGEVAPGQAEQRQVVASHQGRGNLAKAHPQILLQSVRGAYVSVTRTAIVHTAFAHSAALLQPRISTLRQASSDCWQRFCERMVPLAKSIPLPRLQWILYGWIISMIVLNLVVMSIPLRWVNWGDHLPGNKEQHIEQLLKLVPPTASVSASDTLNPHLSDRQYITVFPEITYTTPTGKKKPVHYVVVDLNSVLPENKVSTIQEVNQLISSRQFRTIARAEGVILLVRNSP